ncbi:MAG: cobalamin B12-binding domain-containing protein [Thermodesulfobacteriota bacterium]|nr:cobalamin B12-binding domain-containing protein [Thermodesulfobacteriota bacterium]
MEKERKIRFLMASPGLDGHDRGAKVVARALKDAGMEVIYLGIHRTAEEIVRSAVQEDVDFVGLSMLSGAHLILTEQVLKKMAAQKIDDIPLIVGGTIPKRDREKLKEMGVALIFPTQTPLDEIIAALKEYRLPPKA